MTTIESAKNPTSQMTKKILVLPGDGIGPETTAEAVKVLRWFQEAGSLEIELTEALIGGAAIDAHGVPLPDENPGARARSGCGSSGSDRGTEVGKHRA